MRRLGHVGLSVSDLDCSVDFYSQVLGLEVEVKRTFEGKNYEHVLGLPGVHGRVALLTGEGIELELFEFLEPTPRPPRADRRVADRGISHFCVDVEDIEREYERLSELGVAFHCPPVDFWGAAKATYALDPDGNVFELRQLTSVTGRD